MLRGYRGIVFAAFGWLILSAAQQPTKQSESRQRAEQAARAPQPSPTPPPAASASPTTKFTAYPGYNPDPCYKAQDHDAADLCAQWRAAIAAEKAAHEARRATTWSIIATTLSLATIIGLIITIWQTSGALKEARRGNRLNLLFERRSRREARQANVEQAKALEIAERNADIAAQQVALSEDTARRQLKSYLGVDSANLLFPTMESVEAVVMIKNCGKTPVYNLKAGGGCFARPDGHKIAIGSPGESIVPMILAPNQEYLVQPNADLTDDELRGVRRGELRIYVAVSCEGLDAFGDPVVFKQCLAASGRGNTLTPYPFTDDQTTQGYE